MTSSLSQSRLPPNIDGFRRCPVARRRVLLATWASAARSTQPRTLGDGPPNRGMMIFTDHERTRPDAISYSTPHRHRLSASLPSTEMARTRCSANRAPSDLPSAGVPPDGAGSFMKFSHAEKRPSQALSVVKKIGGRGWKFSLCK